MAGSSTADAQRPPAPAAERHEVVFYYDVASPDAYLAAERVVDVLGTVPEFVPVRIGGVGGFRCAAEETIYRTDVERRAAAYGLMPIRWPAELPTDTEWAMLVATYAKQTGRVVAYSMAAFRQAFAAGRDLSEQESVLIAAAAAELHPAAVIKSAGLGGTRRRLEAATAAAAAAGVRDVPAVRVGDRVFHGDRELEAAAAFRRR
jgi:2-hydroxychromene-2-carboxylate isomerase